MTLKSNWNTINDDENCQQSILSDCNLNLNFNSRAQSSNEKRTISDLNQLSPTKLKTIEKSMFITQTTPKEQHYSSIQQNIDSFTGMATSLKNSMFTSSEALSNNNKCQSSPIDGINTLTNWFQTCTLNENKFSTNCFWSNYKPNNHNDHPKKSPSTVGSHHISKSYTPSVLVQSSTEKTLFDQQKNELWSRFCFTSSTIEHDLSYEHINSISPNMLLQSSKLSSSPSQVVPCSPAKNSFVTKQESFSPEIRPYQMTDLEFRNMKEDLVLKNQSSSKIFFILIIFVIGLVLGYLLKNIYPPNVILSWIDVIREKSLQINIEYFNLLYIHLQTVISYVATFLFV